ncbi:MAG: hypothetical protein AB1489_02805 [Acidobacteriota bacterium]
MSRQGGEKSGVKSTAMKQDTTRHTRSTTPAASEVEGSRSFRARTLGERRINVVRVPDAKVWSTRPRNRRLDGSGHFPTQKQHKQ